MSRVETRGRQSLQLDKLFEGGYSGLCWWKHILQNLKLSLFIRPYSLVVMLQLNNK